MEDTSAAITNRGVTSTVAGAAAIASGRLAEVSAGTALTTFEAAATRRAAATRCAAEEGLRPRFQAGRGINPCQRKQPLRLKLAIDRDLIDDLGGGSETPPLDNTIDDYQAGAAG
jgi:hypothetical protein